jgi:hypothetical protein
MPQRDIYHDTVVEALVIDGWKITDDPLWLSYGGRNVYVDLGAEMPIGAEKNGQKIAVEIKSFVSVSDLYDLELSLGQHELYKGILEEIEPERQLFVAIPEFAYDGIFSEPIGVLVIKRANLKLIVFDENQKRIVKWIT